MNGSQLAVLTLGIVGGNFLYQLFGEGLYLVALERSYFQSMALVFAFFYCRMTKAKQ